MLNPIAAIQATKDDKESDKIEKSVVLYINLPETNYTCAECIYYKERKCALYGPTVSINAYGGCNMWIHGEAGQYNMPWLGLLTKLQTGYMENKLGFSCKRCEEFIAGKNACEKVNRFSEGDDPGMIHPNACCNRFELDKKRGAMPLRQLLEEIK